MLDHDFGHLCFGRRIQISGHSDLGIFKKDGASCILTWVSADTASAACPAHPGSLDKTSITFAAVICDADEPCSVNTASRSTTRPLYFWNCGSNSEFLRWQMSINDAKWSCRWYLLEFFPFFIHCGFRTWCFHCFRHEINLCTIL